MKAWQCSQPLGVESLVWASKQKTDPRTDEIQVEIHAASLNFPDFLIVSNKYQVKPDLPFTPGMEFSGVVASTGKNVPSHIRPGQKVACIASSSTGGFATSANVPLEDCIFLPENFDLLHAAAMFLTYGTAYHALIDRGYIDNSKNILILGAAGGVGTAAIHLAKLQDAFVVAAVSTEDKRDYCLQQGADVAINYAEGDFRDKLKETTPTTGFDLIVDSVGGNFSETAFRSIAWGGHHLVIGFAAGDIPSMPLNLPLVKGASIVGVYWGAFATKFPKANARNNQAIIQLYQERGLRPYIQEVLPLKDLKLAFARLLERKVKGKLVLSTI